jgi:hypothetical protein
LSEMPSQLKLSFTNPAVTPVVRAICTHPKKDAR